MTKQIITYMRSIPSDDDGHNAELISQCVTHLESNQTLGAMLAVVHALNNGEFLLRSHVEVDEAELAEEFKEMFNAGK